PLVNYQGVLRSASGQPLDGDYDMVFRFMSAASAGDEILVDDWSQGVGGPVHVSKGLFNVTLGAGFPTDGSGPGTYTSLSQVFRDYAAVWLEVRVGAETLTPRTLVVSAASALNADHLDGKDAADFIDTSASPQTKAGQLFCSDGVYATSTSGGYGIEAYGGVAGGFFHDQGDSGFAWVGYGNRGVHAGGLEMGGYFLDSDQSGSAELGSGDFGIKAYGNTMGGRFQDLNGSAIAQVASGDDGVYASGNVTGLFGYSPGASGYGVHGQSFGAGGFFEDRGGTGSALVGKDNRGLEASGSEMGGYFKDTDNTSSASLAFGTYGIEAFGTLAGGYFTDGDILDSGYAYVGYGDYGIQAHGETAGGYFDDSNSSGYAYVGYGEYGIQGYGNSAGAYFKALGATGFAYVGEGNFGINAFGSDRGGHFAQTNGGTGAADVAWSDRGIQAIGSDVGGYFGDSNSSAFGMVGYGTYKIYGNGAMSFVQNHPHDKGRVIVYTAPEGDETATYTRGTGQLVKGSAQVSLGETFPLVTDPEIGLTAYVTPRGRAVPLAVQSLSTSTLVVSGPAGEDVVFDYIVYGLRIGFEETTVVQEKTQEARIPSMTDHRQRFEREPGLRDFTAGARFERMEAAVGRPHGPSGAAAALRAAVEEFDPSAHGRPKADREPVDPGPEGLVSPDRGEPGPGSGSPGAAASAATSRSSQASEPAGTDRPATAEPTVTRLGGWREAVTIAVMVGETVEAGDVLVAEASSPGVLKRSATAADRGVVGIVAGSSGRVETAEGTAAPEPVEAPLIVAGIAVCKVDASYGAVRVGDTLTTSPTPGRAMRSDEPIAGAILGKALEPLASGTGSIRVLVTPR
ncbi:MAG TPA: hypothetical protein VGS03_02940, partial [Candidatus Polarisedimenticolia bacterium]|nr:hypothetical protein [Candidatus Polarisedimenticolia bacterium]